MVYKDVNIMRIKHLTLRIEKTVFYKFKHIAEYEKRSLNSQIVTLIKRCIYDFENKNGSIDVEEQ